MRCPFCHASESRVIDSRVTDNGNAIRRRRVCSKCENRFSTVETVSLSVIKRSGVIEPFSREKVINGVLKACQGRPVSDDQLALLAQKVEQKLRDTGKMRVSTQVVGQTILEPLKQLDVVAYLRFASVYESFDDLQDFLDAIKDLSHSDHA